MKKSKDETILLFDIDGTLMRSVNTLHIESFQRSIRRHFNIDASRDTMNIAGMFDRQIIVEMLALNGIEIDYLDPGIDNLCREIGTYYVEQSRKTKNQVKLLSGVTELLTAIKSRGIVAGLVTGNIEAVAWEKIRISGLESLIMPFGGFGDERVTTRGQLIPSALRKAEKHTGLRFHPSRAVIIGDTPRDINAAREAGSRVITVCGTYNREDLEACHPDLILNSLEEIDLFMSFING